MSIQLLCMVLVTLSLPAQDRLLLATGTKAVGSLTFLPTEQRLDTPDQQLANNAETAPMSSQSKSGPLSEGADKLRIELMLEGFKVRPVYFQAHVSFSIVYQFMIGADSHPTYIDLLTGGECIDTKAAEAGLAKWTFAGLEAGKKYVLVLNWEHMRGFVSMSIFSDQLSLSIRLLKDKTGP
jgi:hypothetical protein